jgi:hypothetical protein
MSSSAPPTEVGDGETLARYIFWDDHIRKDLTLKPAAFIPYPYPDLSFTRHLGLSEQLIWGHGEEVAAIRGKPLLGRADVGVSPLRTWGLTPQAAPTGTNLHHVNVVGWPSDKPKQKIIAMEIAAIATFMPPPSHAAPPPTETPVAPAPTDEPHST